VGIRDGMSEGEGDPSLECRLNSARLEAIIAAAMDAIITVDQNFRIVAFNPAAELMFGTPAQKALGEPIDRFIPARFREAHGRHVERFARTGASYRRMGALGAVSALRASGDEFPVEASISQTEVEGERLSTVILRDVSEKRANEETLLLAREVDHRAKNILSIVASLIDLTNAPTQTAYREALSGRIAAMSRAHTLLARERWKGVSLAQLAREELETYVPAARFRCTGPDLMLSARTAQPIGMLLHELATNAVKYGALSVPQGQVLLHWARLPGGDIGLIWQERDGPPVFAPAQAGFGTTLVHQIVTSQLSGRFAADWAPTGLTLDVRLPETILQGAPDAEEDETEQARAPADQAAQAGGTLLIVEDEPLLAMQLSTALSTLGWTVLGVAGSIEDANRLLAEQPRPDVAILDVDLGGAPVFPLARSLRRAGIPFIFCTGYEDVGYSWEFAGCTVVRKPATALQIVTALRDVVRHDGGVAGR